jgi:transposase
MIYIGIDISDSFFTASALRKPSDTLFFGVEHPNDKEGFKAFHALLTREGIGESSKVILEATGVYSEGICHYFHSKNFPVFCEPPLKVRRAFSLKRKNDKVDSKQIAEFGFRFDDLLHRWEPPEEQLVLFSVLLTMREGLTKSKVAARNAQLAISRKHHQFSLPSELQSDMILEAEEKIKRIDSEMRRILHQNHYQERIVRRLMTAPGVGLLLALNLAVITRGFVEHTEYQNLSNYIGVCPHEHSSGSSVYRRPKSSKDGPARIRKLLYLAAKSVRQHDPTMRAYFERLEKNGKNGKLIRNNIANKILRICCAIINSGKPYVAGYVSEREL